MEAVLTGRNILVTRARREKEEWLTLLESYGAKVFCHPTIEIAPPDDYQALDQALNQLEKYHWVLFTSRNSVAAVVKRFNELQLPLAWWQCIKTLAVGPATAAEITKSQLPLTLIPKEFHAEGAVSSLLEFCGDEIGRQNLLFPRAAQGRDILITALNGVAARIDLVTAYQTIMPAEGRDSLLGLFKTGIDVITFTSPSTINNFAEMIAPLSITEVLKDSVVACIGPVTVEAAKEIGLETKIVPTKSNMLMLAEAIKTYFS